MPTRFAKIQNLRPALPRQLRHLPKLAPIAGLAGCLYLLSDHLAEFELSELGLALGQLTIWQWFSATCLTGISFVAVGQYDAVIHRVLGTGVAPGRARAAGVRAIALSQTVGFSSLSGGLVRLRCLPELDLWTVSRLSVLVSLSFLASWAVLAGAVVLWGHTGPTALILLLFGIIGWRVARFRPVATLPGLSPGMGVSLLVWTAIDTSAAALVLGVLLPPAMMPDFQILFAAFLLALGAGLLSQSPAGLGAFEVSLLMLLPQVEQAPLLAAVLAYRVIYFLVPALIALAFLIRPASLPTPARLHTVAGTGLLRALARAPQADWALAYQGAEVVLSRDQSTGWLIRMTGGYVVALGQFLGQSVGPADLTDLQDLASRRGRSVVLYKSDARMAALARAAGWKVTRIAQDAVIRLHDWSLEHPSRRQLRRKLRKLDQGGVRIESAVAPLPLAELTQLAQGWAAQNGGEKGFSMRQFDPLLLSRQRVILAFQADRLIGFASFHMGRDNWSLDLMRQRSDAPCGTMHGLVHAGIDAATQAGMRQVSLAAVPHWPGALAKTSARLPGMAGLRQFKHSFGPHWVPLYICAPQRIGLIGSALSVARAVHADVIARGLQRLTGLAGPRTQNDHEHFGFETTAQACDATPISSRAAVLACPAVRPQLTGRPDDKRPFPPA